MAINAENPKLRDASEMMDQAGKVADDLYHKAGKYLQGDTGKVVGVVAAIAVVGLFGYFLGRQSSSGSPLENY
jgi:hypothetical protein